MTPASSSAPSRAASAAEAATDAISLIARDMRGEPVRFSGSSAITAFSRQACERGGRPVDLGLAVRVGEVPEAEHMLVRGVSARVVSVQFQRTRE